MLVEALIAQICAGLSGAQYEACSHALRAAGIQSRVTQNVTAVEDGVQRYATNQATYAVRRVGIEREVGAVLYVVKVVRDRHVEYRLIRNSGIIPEVRAGASPDTGTVSLRWGF